MLIIAVIVGVVLGAAWGGTFGSAAGALLGWLLVHSHQHQKQISALQQALKLLQAQRGGLPAPGAADSASVEPAGDALPPRADADAGAGAALVAAGSLAPPAVTARTAAPQPDAPDDSLWDTQPGATWEQPGRAAAAGLIPPLKLPSTPPLAPPSTPPSSPPSQPGPLATLKAWLFGGNTIVKLGVGILFIGLAFLAKYASEHVHVPVELRLAGIATVALVLLAVGWRLRLQRPGYAQVLQGGAVAVLYLTLFVAFRFYGVLSAGPVFAAMVVVAALAAALAVLQDARALAVIGALGGFATPLLVSSGSGNQVALFAYYLVLDLGIAAVAWHKTWRSLNLIGFVATFVVGAAWGVMRYSDAHYPSSQAFLIAYFLLFNAILLMPARRLSDDDAAHPQRADGWVNGSLLFGLPAITFALQHGLVRHTDYGTAISALVLAGFYVLMARVMRSRPRLAVTFDASLAIAIVFLTLVIPFALDARSTAGAWALEGAGLVWLGFRQRRGLPRIFGYALLVLAGGAMLWAHDQHGTPTAVFNAYLFNGVMAAVASLAAAYFVWRSGSKADSASGALATDLNADPKVDTNAATANARVNPTLTSLAGLEALAEPLFIAWGTVWALAAAGVQIDAFVKHPFTLAASLVAISGIALAFTAVSARLGWRQLAFPVLGHAPLLALGVLDSAQHLSSPAAGGGWWAWPVALAVHLVVLRHAAPRWPSFAQHLVHALGVLVLAAIGALQGRAITEAWGDASSAWAWLGWLVVPALLLMLLPRQRTARTWPVSAAPSAYQSTAAAVLAVGLLLWTLGANIASNGSARPLPYVPLLNPLDLGVGVALLAVWLWLRSAAAREALWHRPQMPAAVLGVAGFVWLNAMLIRAFHHFGGVPFRFDAWVHSLAVQTGITLLWAATALVLMWLSARSAKGLLAQAGAEHPPPEIGATRLLWMVGAALLAAVVLKLLLVDLSGTGTVTRIVSFIGVGVLMLVIGYVAPLPSKQASKEPGHAAT